MKISESINVIFPKINWTSLNQTDYPRIRFYFDETEKTLKEIEILVFDIFQYIYGTKEVQCCLMLFGDDNKTLGSNVIDSLKKRGLLGMLDTDDIRIENIDEEWFKFYYFNTISVSDCIKINKAILEEDSGIEPLLSLRCYFFSFEKQICINLYDDRGMDIVSSNSDYLYEIYNQFQNTIKIRYEN